MPSQQTINGILDFASKLNEIDLEVLRKGLELANRHRKVEQAVEHDLAGWGLNARQIEILESLYHNPEGTLTPADLSDEVSLTRSAMTSALDSLERQGYTVRSSHPTDRRMVVISLTKTGLAFIEKHLPERYRKVHRIVSCLSEKERDCMLRSYTKIFEFISSDADEGCVS